MSNRLMGLLLVLACILAGIGFYMYSFITYTGVVVVNTNVSGYRVELNNAKTLNPIIKDCIEEKCELKEVPPFEYSLIITKDGYKDYEEKIAVGRKEIKSVVFVLEKDTKLSAITSLVQEETKTNSGTITDSLVNKKDILLSKEEKLERLKNKKAYHAYFEITNFGEVYFKKDLTKMNVYLRDELGKEKRISRFNTIINSSQIGVQKIYGDDSQILVRYGKESFLYNSITASFDQLSLQIPVRYIKVGINRDLQFVTDKGTFIYRDKKFEYFSMFDDFIYKDGNYIGIVRGGDSRRKKNLNFEDESGTLVVLQKQETKEKKILLKPNFEIERILIQGEDVILTNTDSKDYKLENY